jgi:hypothetical protein
MVIDRGHLAYLNVIEKINCVYCSYANGLIAYVQEIASLTEQYWCPIKHARRVIATHERYRKFVDYGDAESYHTGLAALREELRRPRPPSDDCAIACVFGLVLGAVLCLLSSCRAVYPSAV